MHGPGPWLSLALALALTFSFVPARLRAQSSGTDATASARLHFREGLALADRGDWPVALVEFERALALHDSPAVRFNLAQSLEHLGRLIEALAQLDHLEDGGAASRAVTADANELREELTPRIGRIVVAVRGATDDTEVWLAGVPIGQDAWGASIPADPGMVLVELRRGDEVIDSTELAIPEGGVAHVTLGSAVVASPTEAALTEVPDEAPTMPPPAPPGENLAEAWWLWTLVGVAVVGAAVGIVLGVVLSQPASPTQGNFMPGVVELGP